MEVWALQLAASWLLSPHQFDTRPPPDSPYSFHLPMQLPTAGTPSHCSGSEHLGGEFSREDGMQSF